MSINATIDYFKMGIQKFFKLSLLVAVCIGFFSVHSYAQSSTQVNIVGIPPVLSSPLADNIETNFKTGQYQVIFNYSSFSSQPVDFVFEFTLTRNNRTVIEFESLPRAFTPGSYVFTNFFEEVDFPVTPQDVLNQIDGELRNQVVQSGSIPEGNYSIEITARPNVQQSGINTMPGTSIFTVRYPPPPILVSVPDGANLTLETPTFSWTPVASSIGGLFEYEFLLVEVFRGQTPLQAINSNREHAFETLTGQTTLPYTLQYLPLEEGATYAWQVTARDANGQIPLQNDGESEIYTFTYRDKSVSDEVIAKLDELVEINLVPGFAALNNFQRLEVEETANSYIISGFADLNLEFLTINPVTLQAELDRVEIQKSASLETPILMGGNVTARARGMEDLTLTLSDYVSIPSVSWNFAQGLTADLNITTPDGSDMYAGGEMNLSRSGLRGRATVSGSPLMEIGQGPLAVKVNQISVQYPEGQIRAKTEASFLGEEICEVPEFSLLNGDFRVNLNCTVNKSIPMVDQSDRLMLNIEEVNGQITGALDSDDFDFNVVMNSSVDLLMTEDRYCGGSTVIEYSSADGLSSGQFTPTCSMPRPKIDLGFLHATVKNIELDQLQVSEDGAGLDFNVRFDSQLSFPTNPNLALPQLDGVEISNSGITFPEALFQSSELPVNNSFELGNFNLLLERFELDAFTFPWFDWNGEGVGPWSFNFDAGMELPFSADLPGCLSATSLMVENASIASDGDGELAVMGSFNADDIASCSWDIGPGFSLDIHNIGGDAVMKRSDDQFSVRSDINFDADLNVDEPFACSDASQIELNDLSVSLDEGLNGDVSIQDPDCPLQIGPYTADIDNASLQFNYSEQDGQEVALSGAATLNVGEDQTATGTFTLDLRTGLFSDISFEIDGPFEWGIPREDPVLVFTIDEASISNAGLMIYGRQSLNLGESSIGTTFDGLLIDWDTYEILGGRIIFDESFNLAAGVDLDTNSLQFESSTTDSVTAITPGLLMSTAGTVQIDSLGVRSTGTGSASINIDGLDIGDLEIEYSDDFAFGLSPFGVRQGQVDFNWNQQRVAYADENGFFPSLSFFTSEFLPDRIPLPHVDVAYLQIRDEETGDLLITTDRLDNGTFQIDTLEDEELMLTLPVLQRGDEPVVPAVSVQLSQLVINPANGTYVSGSVHADVAEGSNLGNRPNLPFELQEITYTNGVNEEGQEVEALFLSGSLRLFDQVLGDSQDVTLYAQSDGFIRGGVVLPDLNLEVPLDGPGSRVVLKGDSLSGHFDWNPQNIQASQFDLDIKGGFEILDFDGNTLAASDVNFTYDQFGVSVKDFSLGDPFEGRAFDFGFLDIEIPSIDALNLSYSEQTGFDYSAEVDFNLNFDINGSQIPFPLKNVEIRKGLGFVLPEQDIHEGSVPGLSLPSVEFGAFKLEPLALRMDRDTIDVNNLSAGALLDLMPDIDFNFSMPGFEESVPSLAQLNLTVQDANFSEGLFNGDILPLDFDDVPLFLPLGSGAGINLSEIGGSLFEQDDSQGFSIDLDGEFVLPDFFAGSDDSCTPTDVQLNVTRDGYFSGQLSDFEPCGEIDLGALSLQFGESMLIFSHEEDEQIATIEGGVTVSIENTDGDLVETSGFLKYDLINGGILDGSVTIDSEFPWNYPNDDSIFNFYVSSATLNSDGLVMDAGGGLYFDDDTSIDATFNNLTLSLSTFELTDGSVEFSNSFALDVGFGPRTWGINNPSLDPEFSNGVRMTIPENIELSYDGLFVNGQASSALYFGDEQFDAISVDFVDTRFMFSPTPMITEGRADFLHQEEQGEEPVRLAWFDSDGFHPDNLSGAVTLPDTLGLPNKDIAYIVLRDEQGQNLVQSENVEGGLSIFTTDPIDLVIQSFTNEADEPYTVAVEFEDVVVNSALEVTSGAIVADLSGTPLSLQEDTSMPVGIEKLEFRSESGMHQLFADVKVDLPGELSELAMLVQDLLLTPDGFEDVTVELGEYSETYDSDIDSEITHRSFADDNFEITIRGAEFGFGSDRFYRFSGDLKSNLFRNDDGDSAIVHLAAGYQDSDWEFSVDTAHLVPQRLPVGMAELILEQVDFEQDDEHFALIIDSRLIIPEILGDETEIGITGLSVGTNGVSLEEVDTDAFSDQTLTLFGQQDILTISSLGIEITDDMHLIAALDGSMDFLNRTFEVDDLRIGTDGTFSVGEGGVNLIADGPVNLLGDNLILTTLEIGVDNNVATLTALADLELPEPVETSSTVGFTVNQLGQVTVQQPDINFSGVSKEIPGFATVSLDDAGFELNSLEELDFGFYAMASVEAGGETIEFGQAGNRENWGIRYAYGGSLEWRITNSPSFEFENEMFTFSVDGVQAETQESFVLQMNVGAELRLAGVSGSIAFDGMEIDAAGSFDLGTFSESDLDIGPVAISVTSFEYLPDGGTITIEQEASGSTEEDPNIEEVSMNVSEYLSFGGSMTIPGFSGSVEEVLYYRQGSDVFFSVRNFHAELSDMAKITASLEYQSVGSEFELMVAGSAEFTPPEGDAIGLAAMGAMGNIGGEFSFGIFVKANVTVPIFPGALTMTSFGAGFFYNPKAKHYDTVLQVADHSIPSDASPPWEKEGGSGDFAIIAYAGVGIVGEAGTYAIEGSAILMITDSWLVLDVDGQIFDGSAAVDVGMYLSVQWSPSFQLEGLASAELDYSPLAEASFDLSVTVIKNQDDIIWGVQANIDVHILITSFEGTFIAGNDGFYMSLSTGYDMDISIISAGVNFELEVWWIKDQQFGAWIEFDAYASIAGGAVASGEVGMKGGLLVDDGYLIYAYGRLKVEAVFGLISAGTYDLSVSIEDGNISGSRGRNSEHERALADAKAQAEQMNQNLTDAIEAANDLSSVIEDRSRDAEELAQAGEQILSSDFRRVITYGIMALTEKNLTGEVPDVFQAILDAFQEIESIPDRSDYNLVQLQENINDLVDVLTASLDDLNAQLSELEAQVIDYQEAAETSLEDLLESPVMSAQLDWMGDQPPSFEIDDSQENANKNNLEDIKADIEAMEQEFEDAIAGVQANISTLDDILFSDVVGLNLVAEEFHQVTKGFDELYANMAAMYWDIRRWATLSRSLFLEADSDLEEAVINQAEWMLEYEGIEFDYSVPELLNEYSDFSDADFEELAHIAAMRDALIMMHTEDGDGFNSAYDSEKNTLDDMVDSGQYANFSNSFVTRAKEFWYEVPVLGYAQLRESSGDSGEDVDVMYEEALSPVKDAYVQFTNRIDELYGNKHAIHATYEEILRQYISWREDMFDDPGNSVYEDMKADNAEKATTPSIGYVSVSREQTGFVNKLNVSWNSTHPTGIVPEHSYYINDESGSEIFDDRFISVGSKSEFSRYLFRRSLGENNRSMSVRVRSRGPSGLSITRNRTYSTNLNPPLYPPSEGIVGSFTFTATIVFIDDDSVPDTPTLSVPYHTDEYQIFTTMQTLSGPSLIAMDMERYWTNRDDMIEFTASSYDETTDIQGFEFMLGTSPNDSTYMGWTSQTGTPVNGSASNEQMYQIYGLSLVEGEEYYVTVRAKNGAGNYSEASSIGPILLDQTPPTQPGVPSSQFNHPTVEKLGDSGTFYSAETTGLFLMSLVESRRTPEIQVGWVRSNKTSGSDIYRYRIVVSESDDTGTALTTGETFYGGGNNWNKTIASDALEYSTDYYFHIMAEDYAGNLSDPIVYGSQRIKDPTTPTAPSIVAKVDESNIGVTMLARSQDPETGVDYYEYSFKNDYTGQNISGAGGTYDPSTGNSSYIPLSTDNLPKGVPLKVVFVAVNEQGERSHPGESAPVIYDTTPPESLTATAIDRGDEIEINLNGVQDPESGIASVEYRVINKNITFMAFQHNWTPLVNLSSVSYQNVTGSASYHIGDTSADDYVVYIRVRNGNGMEKVISRDPVVPITITATATFTFN